MDGFLDSFLSQEEDAVVELAAGEGFSTSGMIGRVMADVLFSFWTSGGIHTLGGDDVQGLIARGLVWRGKEGNWRYYAREKEVAAEAGTLAGQEYGPRQVWHLEAAPADVLNFASADALEKWSAGITGDVNITTLRSKRRYDFHLMALPSFVQALAIVTGALPADTRIFHMDELMGPDLAVTDEFEKEMVGGEAGNFKESVLWKRRAELWAALGESNPDAYLTISAGDKKFSTTSPALDKIFQAVNRRWREGIWAKFSFVPSPLVKATYQGGEKRLSVLCILKVYPTKAAAEEEAKKELEAMGAESTAAAPETAGLTMPKAWVGYEKDFSAEIAKIKAANPTRPAQPLLMRLAADLSITASELEAWAKWAPAQ